MPLSTITIVLAAAVAHAAWNLASKYKQSDTVLFVAAYTTAPPSSASPSRLVLPSPDLNRSPGACSERLPC